MPDVSVFDIQGTSINVKDTTARTDSQNAQLTANQALEKVTKLESLQQVNVSYTSETETITITTGGDE